MLDILKDETELGMKLLGCDDVKKLNKNFIALE